MCTSNFEKCSLKWDAKIQQDHHRHVVPFPDAVILGPQAWHRGPVLLRSSDKGNCEKFNLWSLFEPSIFCFCFFLSKTSEEKLDPLVFLTPRRNSIHQPYISMTGFYQALRQCDDFLSLFPATLHIILHPPMLLLTKSKPSLPFMLSESPMAPLLISGFGVQILTRLGQSWFDLPTWTEAFELKNVLDTHLSELLIKLFKLLCHHSLSSTVSLRRVYFPLHYNKYIKVICSYAKFFYCFNPMLDPTL